LQQSGRKSDLNDLNELNHLNELNDLQPSGKQHQRYTDRMEVPSIRSGLRVSGMPSHVPHRRPA
jgi:hypothetical protein